LLLIIPPVLVRASPALDTSPARREAGGSSGWWEGLARTRTTMAAPSFLPETGLGCAGKVQLTPDKQL